MSKTQWTRIKMHLLPSVMQEVEVTELKYCNLVNKLKTEPSQELIDSFYQLRTDISERIEEIEDYLDQNFGNQRMLILSKAVFQLKKLLFYNPDINNDLEESDLPKFHGISLDLRKVQRTNPAIKQLINQTVQKKKEIGKKEVNSRASDKNVRLKGKKPSKAEEEKRQEEEVKNEENNDQNRIDFAALNKEKNVKKKLQIRLTDDEYRLLLKLKARKNAKLQ